MNFEERLEQIFKEGFQIRRVMKEIENLREAKANMGLQVRYSITKQVHLTIFVEILKKKLKQMKKLSFLNKLQFKIVLKTTFPTTQPQLYFMLQNSIQMGINPYYDYLPALFQEWSVKYSMVDLIKQIPAFLVKCIEKAEVIEGRPVLNAYFQIDRMFTSQGCQTFPVQLIRGSNPYEGLLVIVNGIEIILFEKTNFQGCYSISDFIKISEVMSVQKHKTKHIRCMLEIKRSGSKLAVEFTSEEYDTIIDAIADNIKANSLLQKESSEESESSDDEGIIDRKLQKPNQQLVITDENIKDVQSEILILQSLVDDKPMAGNIKELVDLLKKTVEYYSVKGDIRCQAYLRTLQNIMNNEFMQVLLASQDRQKKGYQKKEYESIANLV